MSTTPSTIVCEKKSENNLVAVILALGAVVGLNLLNPLVLICLIAILPIFLVGFVFLSLVLLAFAAMVGQFVGSHMTAVVAIVLALVAAFVCRFSVQALLKQRTLEQRVLGLEQELAAVRCRQP